MRLILCCLVLCISSLTLAWDGYDWESGNYVEIEDGNLVREGEEIEIYDWETGEYKDVEVELLALAQRQRFTIGKQVSIGRQIWNKECSSLATKTVIEEINDERDYIFYSTNIYQHTSNLK